jgi:hypothetical protein
MAGALCGVLSTIWRLYAELNAMPSTPSPLDSADDDPISGSAATCACLGRRKDHPQMIRRDGASFVAAMRDNGVVPESRVSYRDVRPIVVAASLAELIGPTAHVFELPRNLVWSGQSTFDFGDDADLLAAYKIVLVESMRAEYLRAWLHEATLRRLWSQLRLPVAVRDRWQQAFPDLVG